MKINELYIVGHFKDGTFKQVDTRSGYTGTRMFKRLKYAEDFLNESCHSSLDKIYKITEVEELDASKYEL